MSWTLPPAPRRARCWAPTSPPDSACRCVAHAAQRPAALTGSHAQHVVPAGAWFGSHLADDTAVAGPAVPPPPGDSRDYALVGCTVAPGFDFADFEMAKRGALLAAFPHAAADIARLTDPE